MGRVTFRAVLCALTFLVCAAAIPCARAADYDLFARTNLVAWCIVPFDGKKRGPEERAAMLEKLGFTQFAYDYRAEHVPTFDTEMDALARHHIHLLAWWFPTQMNDEARLILDVLRRHNLRGVELWVMGGGEPTHSDAEHAARVASEAARIRPIAEEAAKLGSTVGLYNHGGWFGEPENQLAILELLRSQGVTNVGIVYNLHHGHAHVQDFPEVLAKLKPYLLEVTLNGMGRDAKQEILPIGQGEFDAQLLKQLRASGWHGPVGILNHTDEDAEARLRMNLAGLEKLASAELGSGKPDYWAVEDAAAREKLPLYKTIPAATSEELTPANGFPKREAFLTWHRSHGDNGGMRYSALDQINRDNVKNLEVAWVYHAKDGKNNLECNPIIVDGVMFGPTPGEDMVAVNAETGAEIWRFSPEGRPAYRGLIYWPGTNGATERILFCAGQWLHALDPKTGKPIVSFGKEGKTKLPGKLQGRFGTATAAPAICDHIVVVPGFEKDVWGFDIVTGELLWTFHTVPHAGEFGYDTWDKTEEYAANAWSGMAMDEVRGIAYVGTGSPKPNFIGVPHRGDNLFANCLIAIDARTGKRLWHFQEIPHDIWDRDITAPPNLATITRNGKKIDVVTVCTKIGDTLLLDRVTGKPIFPFRMRRAPASTLPGEVTAPYQPDPELPEPFSTHVFTQDDLTTRTPEAAEFALARFKSADSGFFQPFREARANLYFGMDGGAEWTGACIDAPTGRLYVTANHLGWMPAVFRNDEPADDENAPKTAGQKIFEARCAQCHGGNRMGIGFAPPLRGLRHRLTEEAVTAQIKQGKNAMPANADLSDPDLKALVDFLFLHDRPAQAERPKGERPEYNSTGYPKFLDQDGYPANKPPWGTLNCLDLNTGKLLWKVPLGEYPELVAQGLKNTGSENYGGATVTAGGLVFCAGTKDTKIRAFDKDTGAELWSAKLPWGGNAPVATYEVNGRQYIVIAATGGGHLGGPTGDAYVAFALPEKK